MYYGYLQIMKEYHGMEECWQFTHQDKIKHSRERHVIWKKYNYFAISIIISIINYTKV